MRLKLPDSLANKLLELPESGMGYQNVTVKFVNGLSLDTFVLNGALLELPDDSKYIQEIAEITPR